MKIIFLCTTTLTPFQLDVLAPFFRQDHHTIIGCVIDGRPRPSHFSRILHHLKKGRGGYVMVMAIQSLFAKPSAGKNAEEFFIHHNIPTFLASNPYANDSLSWITSKEADVLLLIGGYGIIKEPLLSLCPQGVFSYHHGDMRKYRGQPPALWELYNNEAEMGVTVQKLHAGLDSGNPIVEKRFPIQRGDTLHSVVKRIYDGSPQMMFQAIETASKPGFCYQSLEKLGTIFTHPNLRQWLLLQVKILWRQITR